MVSAVERYLSQRGVAPQPAAAAQLFSVDSIVDRFLATRNRPSQPAKLAFEERMNPVAESRLPEATGVPEIQIADFVCESDVREAARENRKIYIGSKTIVTPSARDLAAGRDTLVVTVTESASARRSSNE